MSARIVLSSVAMCSMAMASAQQSPPPASGATPPGWAVSGSSRQDWVSPDLHADRSITFRISAPTAAGVKLRFADKDHAMVQDPALKGVWSATVGPVEPVIYSYSFEIGGARVNNGQVEVPGSAPRYDELRDVPHGSIVLRTYSSKIQGRQRSLRVYLPPQYHSEPNRKFPVLYLFNGQDEVQWTTEGKVNVVLDNLIADKKAVPMVIVMPNNTIHGENIQQKAPYAAKATTPEGRAGLASSAETVAVLEKELPGEIMPMIEKDYRVLTDRNNRAIAGLSFGGGTAFGVGMRHLELFNYVGEFGTGTFGGLANPPSGYVSYAIPYDPEKIAPGIYKNLLAPATRPKVFYMSCGELDPRHASQKLAYEDFRKHGIEPVFMTFPGGHEFKFFRRAMADYVARLFK
jgi:enterochelin esterase family protein